MAVKRRKEEGPSDIFKGHPGITTACGTSETAPPAFFRSDF
jgi:hypothetical protein